MCTCMHELYGNSFVGSLGILHPLPMIVYTVQCNLITPSLEKHKSILFHSHYAWGERLMDYYVNCTVQCRLLNYATILGIICLYSSRSFKNMSNIHRISLFVTVFCLLPLKPFTITCFWLDIRPTCLILLQKN